MNQSSCRVTRAQTPAPTRPAATATPAEPMLAAAVVVASVRNSMARCSRAMGTTAQREDGQAEREDCDGGRRFVVEDRPQEQLGAHDDRSAEDDRQREAAQERSPEERTRDSTGDDDASVRAGVHDGDGDPDDGRPGGDDAEAPRRDQVGEDDQ